MEYSLDASHDGYIKVSVLGVINKFMLIAAMSDLMSHADYTHKHSLWDFSESSMGLSIGDLKEVAGGLRLYKPQSSNFANKSAIVVPGQMHKAMVDMFIAMTKLLPFDYKAFKTADEAKTFLKTE